MSWSCLSVPAGFNKRSCPHGKTINIMLVSDGYERLFKEIGVEDEPSQKIILEYIFSLVRIGIEYVNNKKNS